jgi:hypothetical protein
MRWLWVDNMLYCSAELEPNRSFILTFDLNTLRWSKLDIFFLDQVFNLLTDYNKNVLVETRHKVIHSYLDPLRRNQQDGEEELDTKCFVFYRLPVG